MDYIVLRQHFGDRQYFSGEIRPIDDKMVADKLIKLGVLADPNQKPTDDKANDKTDDKPSKPSQKLDPRPKNKMAKAPQNKAQNNQDDNSDKGNL